MNPSTPVALFLPLAIKRLLDGCRARFEVRRSACHPEYSHAGAAPQTPKGAPHVMLSGPLHSTPVAAGASEASRPAPHVRPRALRSLTVKLTLAFLIVSLAGTALAAVFARWATAQAFDRLVADQAQTAFAVNASTYYQAQGSWAGLASQSLPGPPAAGTLTFQPAMSVQAGAAAQYSTTHVPALSVQSVTALGPGVQAPSAQKASAQLTAAQPASFSIVLLDPERHVIVPGGAYQVGEPVPAGAPGQETPVMAGGQMVGTVFATGKVTVLDPLSARYLARTNQALLYASLVGVAIALLLGILLARAIARPLAELTAASRAMAKGRFQQQVPIRSQDELGELATAFNQMSADLHRASELQRQMTADIAHELRSPLTVITGYLEGLRDGVIQPSTARFAVLHDEAQQLTRLVEDLRTLSLADAGELTLARQPVAADSLLARVAEAFAHQAEQAGITLQVRPGAGLPDLDVDPERILQVLANLVSNALRYTPSGGAITLFATAQTGSVQLHVADTGQGIPAEMVPHVFERFYRGDASRSQQNGESGLGLAIVRSIVEAHGGTIMANSEGPGRGAHFSVRLPVA